MNFSLRPRERNSREAYFGGRALAQATKLVKTYDNILTFWLQAIGGAQDAARMHRVVSFYEKLPRGPAPDVKPTGLLGRYQARYFGKNPSAARESSSSASSAVLRQGLWC